MAKSTKSATKSTAKAPANGSRFALVIDGREVARAASLAKAQAAFVKHRGTMRDSEFRRPTIQDTAPAGKPLDTVPIVWAYRGRGVWSVVREHTIPKT